MNRIWKKSVLALATGATLLAMAAPAQARPYGWDRGYHGGYRHHGGGAGAAVAGGIVGLALGAAIASNGRPHGDRYYREGYYDDGYYRRGYDRRGYDRPYYDDYRRGYAYDNYRACRTERFYDEYRDTWTTVQRCR